MTKPAQKILDDALALDVDDRTVLIAQLCDSLHADIDPAIERAWIDESERRWSAYQRGETTALPAEDVMRDLRQRFNGA